MNTIHDLGGMDGFTLTERDQGPVLKEDWERQVWGMAVSLLVGQIAGGKWTFTRADIERIPPELYLNMPYYAKWLHACETALVGAGVVTRDERAHPESVVAAPDAAPMEPEEVAAILARDLSFELPATSNPRFTVGDEVVVRNQHPSEHTRAPRYTRGRRGVIGHHHGMHVFEDQFPEGEHPGPQHLYTVVFAATELWGNRGHRNDRIYVDLAEFHLDAAG
ncbi:MAG: nitrile hydratase subunit beta [Gammaproteobacteria bacterium]